MPAKEVKKASAPAPAAAKKSTGPVSATGIYVGPIDIRNQTAEEVRARFAAYGPVAQLRTKRTNKAKHPYALVWYKTPEDAKKALAELQRREPAGTNIEMIRAAKPTEPRHTYTTSIHINPINVPARSSKGYGNLAQNIRKMFPEAVKTRLHKEQNGTGSAVIYFKDNAAAKAAKTKLAGKFNGKPVTVKPSCRTLAKDHGRFVKPLQERTEYKKALAAQLALEKKAKEEEKVAATKAIKDKQLAAVASKKAADAAAVKAKESAKAAADRAASDAAMRAQSAKQIGKPGKGGHGAPSKVPAAKTAAREPNQKTKTTSRKH